VGVSPLTVKAWMRKGKLPVTRIGDKGLLRVRAADLDTYIRELSESQPRGMP
jgi:excisionase family DNA binding protein